MKTPAQTVFIIYFTLFFRENYIRGIRVTHTASVPNIPRRSANRETLFFSQTVHDRVTELGTKKVHVDLEKFPNHNSLFCIAYLSANPNNSRLLNNVTQRGRGFNPEVHGGLISFPDLKTSSNHTSADQARPTNPDQQLMSGLSYFRRWSGLVELWCQW